MTNPESHPWTAAVRLDGGTLDCGNGLLLRIRRQIDPLQPGQLLELLSRQPSVREDLPAWSRLTGNDLVSVIEIGDATSYLISRGPFRIPETPDAASHTDRPTPVMAFDTPIVPVTVPSELPAPRNVPPIAPLTVTGIGSWPRPNWLLRTLHEYLSGRLAEAEFHTAADDAVRLCVEAQRRAGVTLITDGEQRRDDYASFVADRLDNCQLVPLTDLLPYVDHPDEFAEQLRSLDVPAEDVRHPAVFGPLGRGRPIATHEFEFVRRLTDQPVKISLPGPYLLTRTMWMECISDQAYASREALAADVVRVLREEVHHLLAAGVTLVQLDEPVLTEVVHGRTATGNRSFMCGALGNRGPRDEEPGFATSLINAVVDGLPQDRLALHICRGNWTRDESRALSGDFRPLLSLLSALHVGTFFLELCTPRAGDLEILRGLPSDRRIGVGVIDQKSTVVESVDEVVARGERAIRLFGADRVLLNPDCGFATFADSPITAGDIAEAKLRVLVDAADRLRRRHGVAE